MDIKFFRKYGYVVVVDIDTVRFNHAECVDSAEDKRTKLRYKIYKDDYDNYYAVAE